jgi:hypothetical protein
MVLHSSFFSIDNKTIFHDFVDSGGVGGIIVYGKYSCTTQDITTWVPSYVFCVMHQSLLNCLYAAQTKIILELCRGLNSKHPASPKNHEL